MSTTATLPKMKPSALIALALRDLRKAERDRHYMVDMSVFHRPEEPAGIRNRRPGPCAVCFAGAVMAKTLKCSRKFWLAPSGFSDRLTREYLTALDTFREGRLWQALGGLGISLPWGMVDDIVVPEYERDRGGFHKVMGKLVKLLKCHNL